MNNHNNKTSREWEEWEKKWKKYFKGVRIERAKRKLYMKEVLKIDIGKVVKSEKIKLNNWYQKFIKEYPEKTVI